VLDVTAGHDEEQLTAVTVDTLARDVLLAFIQVCEEMFSYSKSLLEKPQIVVLNQSDKLSEEQKSLVVDAFLEQLAGIDKVFFRAIDENQVFLVSAVGYQGLGALFDAVALQA
jgi:GTPase involved in cell partitioning and DNA repair